VEFGPANILYLTLDTRCYTLRAPKGRDLGVETQMAKPIAGKPPQQDTLRVHVPGRPRKRPRQARSLLLVDALKEAGWDILASEGRAALSASRLSERSGVAVSSIYEYFPTMEALVAAIFHDYRVESRAQLLADIRALPPSARLLDGILVMMRAGAEALRKWSLIDPEFNVRSTHYDELVRLDLVKTDQVWPFVATSALLERFSDEVLVRDREKALFLFYQAIQALPRAIALERPAYLAEPDTPILLARMLHALLTTPGV
jgi:AcrR family transcriptional regulator